MKITKTVFYFLKQFGYLWLHIGSNRDSFEVFHLFSMYLKDRPFKYLENQYFFGNFK